MFRFAKKTQLIILLKWHKIPSIYACHCKLIVANSFI